MHFIGLLATTHSVVVGGSINENADGCILSTGSELITVNNVAISASGPRHQPPSGNLAWSGPDISLVQSEAELTVISQSHRFDEDCRTGLPRSLPPSKIVLLSI